MLRSRAPTVKDALLVPQLPEHWNRSGPDLLMEGRDAGEDIGNHRYIGRVAGKPGAVDGSVAASVLDERRTGADCGTHPGQHHLDVAVGDQRQLLQSHIPQGWMIVLPQAGLLELDK